MSREPIKPKAHIYDYVILCAMILFFMLCTVNSHSQNDTTRKNTVKFNITNPMLFGTGSIILGYERMLKNSQSFSIHVGRSSYPIFTFSYNDSSELRPEANYEDKGFHISGDYRFYLKGQNKYLAPCGIYIGPYYSYNYFSRTNNWTLNSDSFQGSVESDLNINIQTIGVELGYQFVFWDRLSVDMILIGPGIGFYSFKNSFNTSLSEEDQILFFDQMNEMLSEKIPGYSRVIDSGDFKKTGSMRITDLGYRYMVLVGFRF
jgi:hypothetical protein